MSFTSSITIANQYQKEVTLHLEPWGEQFAMPCEARFVITGESVEPGSFEIEFGNDEIFVWLWLGSVARVFSNGKELGDNIDSPRTRVPTDIP